MADWSVPRKVRKSNFSTDEVDVLVDSVKTHYNILYGKYAKRATNRWIRQKAWLDILRKVNGVSVEKRTLQEVKNKWKKCQYALKEKVCRGSLADDPGESSWDDVASAPPLAPPIHSPLSSSEHPASRRPAATMRRKNRYNRHLYNAYDLDLKKSVVIFAEENGNKEAQARYGISEANIRRWRRLKNDIFGRPDGDEYDRGKLRTRKRVNYACKLEKGGCADSVDADSQSQGSVGESPRYSMPLQERLSKVAAQEKIAAGAAAAGPLKSQPLSPTKLKVTRQSPKTARQTAEPPPPSPVNEEMCLRWNSHHSNMQTAFPSILSKEQYVDVTLAAEGKTLKCHRLILSSCSPYFEEILSGISPFQHPVLFMRDIPFWILKSLCDFMYAGEVHIFQNKLEELLTVAEALKIKGLAGKSTPPENPEDPSNKNDNNSTSNNNNNNPNNKEKKKSHPSEKEKTHQQPQPLQQYHHHHHHAHPPPLKKNPVFTQSNNFESTSHDYDDDDLLDPLDLLEPLYEEVAEEKKPSSTVVKPKEIKYQQYQPMKKPFTRKLRKRKYSEVKEPSPPPVFSFRKGTRSRPNVKIPKYYHSDYSNNAAKPTPNSQTDPLLEVDEIKTEPIDVEDNLIDYSDEDHYLENSLDPANCDSPVIITSTKHASLPQQDKFKKIKLTRPIITEVHTIDEGNTTSGGLEVIKITLQQPQSDRVVTNVEHKKRERRGRGVVMTENEVQAPVLTMEIDAEDPPPEDAEPEELSLEPECIVQIDEPPEENVDNPEERLDPERITEAVSETATVVEEQVPEVSAVIADVETVDSVSGDVETVENVVADAEVETIDDVETVDNVSVDGETVDNISAIEISVAETVDNNSTEAETVDNNSTEAETVDIAVIEISAAETVDNNSAEAESVDNITGIEISGAETVAEATSEQIEEETGNNDENEEVANAEETPLQDIRIEDVRTTCLEEMNDLNRQTEEELRATSLDHLEKEAMNVANAINMESQAGPPDIE